MNRFDKHLRATLVAAIIIAATSASPAAADTLTLEWDLNSEADVTGYQVHIGLQPGVYTQTVDVGNTDTFVFNSAVPGQQYCFVVTAYAGDLTSPYSTEVCSSTTQGPYLSQPFNQRTTVGQGVSLQLSGGDPDGLPLTYAVSGLPPGLSVNSVSGLITGVPNAAGNYIPVATVSDGSLSASRTFTWTVIGGNSAPVISNPGSLTTDVGQSVSLQMIASDPDGQAVTFGATGLPPGLTIGASNGRITGQPVTPGVYTVTVLVSDGTLSSSQTFTWTIRGVNQAPTLTNPGTQTTNVGQATSLQLHGSDPNGDALTYVASGLPVGMQVTTSTGNIAGTPTAAGDYNVTVTVSDGSLFASQSFLWSVRVANQAPALTNPGTQTGDVGQPSVLQLQATDPNGDNLTYSVSGLPAGLQLAVTTGRITGTPTTAGTFTVNATVSDGLLSASQSFTWTVRAANVAPALTNPGSQTNDLGQVISLQLQAVDANNDTLTFQASGLPIGLQINAATGRITGTPSAEGFFNVSATVTDGSLIATQTFTWTIRTPNVAPVLTNPGNQTTDVNQPVVLQLQATDANSDALTFSATGLPAGLQMTAATGRIAGTSTTTGTTTVNVTVSDGHLSASQSFTWTIRSVNVAPVLTNPADQSTDVGTAATLQLQATDANGDTLTFSAIGLPPGLNITPNTGLISGTPTAVGVFAVTVSVNDGALTANRTLTWTVTDPAVNNGAPTMSNPGARRNDVGDSITLQPNAHDPDNDPLTFSAANLPPGLALNTSTGLITGSPTTPGLYSVALSVSDGTHSVSQGFTWTIRAANIAPVVTNPGDQTSEISQFLALAIPAADANGDILTFSATGLPTGLQIGAGTGVISGTPTLEGRFSVQITVSDGTVTASQSFLWTIDRANVPPALSSPGNQTAVVNQPTLLQLQGSDADGDSLTFGAAGLPPGLVLTSGTGRIAGTPTAAGTYAVTISVSDGATTVQRSFTWTVLPPNVAPVLTNPGNQTTLAGQAATLQLQATDANGDTLVYQISGLPSGLQLTTSSGSIAGTPQAPGSYTVMASVTDGALSAQQTFTWTVTAVNAAPTLASPGSPVSMVSQPVSLQLVGSDLNGDVLTYAASGLPSGITLATSTGLMSGTPTTAGTYTVIGSVSDGSLTAQRSFTWTVQPANGTPVLKNPGTQSSTTGQAVALQLQGSDPNGDRILYAVIGVPPGLVLNSSTGRITGTPLAGGNFQVTASVSDGLLSAQQMFTWSVAGPNIAPALVNPGNQTSNAGDLIALQLVGSDLNNDPLTYSATGLPPGVQISRNTGLIAGTVTTTGSYPVMVAVNDGSLTTQRTFTWNVVTPAPAPVTETLTILSRSLASGTATGTQAITRPTEAPITSRSETSLFAQPRTGNATAPTTSVLTGNTATTRSVASGTATGATGALHRAPADSSSTTSMAGTPATHSIASDETPSASQASARSGDVQAGTTQTGILSALSSQSATGLSVAIQTPVDRTEFEAGAIVHFAADARDAGRDVSAQVVWSSNLDGVLGSGASMTKVLSGGVHSITAMVTDSAGRSRRATITVIVH